MVINLVTFTDSNNLIKIVDYFEIILRNVFFYKNNHNKAHLYKLIVLISMIIHDF